MSKNNNDSEKLNDIVPRCGDNTPIAETQDDELCRNLFIYPTAKEAARRAGFTGHMLKSGVYKKIHSKRFQDRLRRYAIAHNVMTLPKILMIEDKIIDHLLKKPLEANKHTRMLAEKKRIGGILAQELQPSVRQTISIKSMQIWWKKMLLDDDAEVIDVQIEDNNKE